jgi:hypothetical protein
MRAAARWLNTDRESDSHRRTRASTSVSGAAVTQTSTELPTAADVTQLASPEA